MAFQHYISFATVLAANFGCNWFRIMPEMVFKLSSLWAVIWSVESVPFSRTGKTFPIKSFEIPLHMKKKSVVSFDSVTFTSQNSQNIKTILTLNLSQYQKSGSNFSSREHVAACRDCQWIGNALCLCLPVRPAQAFGSDCQMTGRGSKYRLLEHDKRAKVWNPSINCVELEFF